MSPDPALFILPGDDDDVSITLMITGQRVEREREREREVEAQIESFSPPSTVPLTRHHLYCQRSSARLAPT